MSTLHLLSDHVYDWSARSIKQTLVCAAQAPSGIAAQTAAVGCGASRLADRALQALWQAGMQMRRRSRPRPEVLPVGELSRRATADGLRATGKSAGDPRTNRQLPRGTHDARGSLRDQPRAVTAPRGAVRAGGERNVAAAHRPARRHFSP